MSKYGLMGIGTFAEFINLAIVYGAFKIIKIFSIYLIGKPA